MPASKLSPSPPPAPAALAVIPARYGSTRFPGKVLADRTGRPLIAHVIERVRQATRVSGVVVATDDQRIAEAVRAEKGMSGGNGGGCGVVVMTRGDHVNGTSRIAEAVELLELGELETGATARDSTTHGSTDIIVNVQADEPEIDPAVIDRLIEALQADVDAPMATVATPFDKAEDAADPNLVKVVVDQRGRALYFSRSLIPYQREGGPGEVGQPLKHMGIYAYRRPFLSAYVALPPSPLEQAEQLEQLRALEQGHPIAVVRAAVAPPGIDTPAQYEAFVARYRHMGG